MSPSHGSEEDPKQDKEKQNKKPAKILYNRKQSQIIMAMTIIIVCILRFGSWHKKLKEETDTFGNPWHHWLSINEVGWGWSNLQDFMHALKVLDKWFTNVCATGFSTNIIKLYITISTPTWPVQQESINKTESVFLRSNRNPKPKRGSTAGIWLFPLKFHCTYSQGTVLQVHQIGKFCVCCVSRWVCVCMCA